MEKWNDFLKRKEQENTKKVKSGSIEAKIVELENELEYKKEANVSKFELSKIRKEINALKGRLKNKREDYQF
jgi:hypothetical protein